MSAGTRDHDQAAVAEDVVPGAIRTDWSIPPEGLQIDAVPLVRKIGRAVKAHRLDLRTGDEDPRGLPHQAQSVGVIAVEMAHEHQVEVPGADAPLLQLLVNGPAGADPPC